VDAVDGPGYRISIRRFPTGVFSPCPLDGDARRGLSRCIFMYLVEVSVTGPTPVSAQFLGFVLIVRCKVALANRPLGCGIAAA
jgi:hypothetical protein